MSDHDNLTTVPDQRSPSKRAEGGRRYADSSALHATLMPSAGEQAVLAFADFETLEGSQGEDALRLADLKLACPITPPVGWTNIGSVLRWAAQHVPGRRRPRFDCDNVLRLMAKLDPQAVAAPTTLASAVAMRATRVMVLGGLLDALASYTDAELCTVTIVKPAWVFTPADLAAVSARDIKVRFEQDLIRTGVSTVEGPLVAFLHGEWEPTSGVYVLHYHLVTTRAKATILAKKLRDLKHAYRPQGIVKRPIRISKMRNRVAQVTYLLKRYWPSRPILMIDGRERRCRRTMRVGEPYSSAYLVWLDQQPLIDLTVMNGTWSKRKGGSVAWKPFYVLVTGRGKSKRLRWRPKQATGLSILSAADRRGGG